MQDRLRLAALLGSSLLLSACLSTSEPVTKITPATPQASQPQAASVPAVASVPTSAVVVASDPASIDRSSELASYQEVGFADLPGWQQQATLPGFLAWKRGCPQLQTRQPHWQASCAAAAGVAANEASVRQFLQQHFRAWRLLRPNGSDQGLITGYYEPIYRGSLTRTVQARFPAHGVPPDLLSVELSAQHPELRNRRVRGRLDGRRVIPYFDSAALRSGKLAQLPVLAWLEDPIDLQFMQIQGSGRVQLPDGRQLRLGYADQNGHPYFPIGRWLVRNEGIPAAQMSMQRIRQWANANPQRIDELLDSNPSYVFFRALPDSDDGPIGSLGIPLTEGYSIAIDPRSLPLGSLAWLATTRPDNGAIIQRLVAAQDTGGAIRGAVRADFYWGSGDVAGELAGEMKQDGQLWLLWPRNAPAPQARP